MCDHADPALYFRWGIIGETGKSHPPGIWPNEKRGSSQERGLPRPIGTEERNKFAGKNFERDAAQSDQRAVTLFHSIESQTQALGTISWIQEAGSAPHEIAKSLLELRALAAVILI